MINSPFARAWQSYSNQGLFPVPVHARGKELMVPGYTGRRGRWADQSVMSDWAKGFKNANIGLRLTPDMIGIDVDAYDGKEGAETLAELEAELGELPSTAVTTSREDGTSGIRIYRLGAYAGDFEASYKGIAGPGIEIITWYHRYAIVAPSVHESGREYQWHGTLDEIGELPEAWYMFLVDTANETDKLDVPDSKAFISEHGAGEMCALMQRTMAKHVARIRDAGSGGGAHDAARDGCAAVCGDMAAGHTGGMQAVSQIYTAFYKAVKTRRRGSAFDHEWARIRQGGAELAAGRIAEHGVKEDFCASGAGPEILEGWRPGGRKPITQFDKDVRAKAYQLRVGITAKHVVEAESATPIPSLTPLSELEPEDDGGFIVHGIVPRYGNALVVAQRKAGKTTLRDNFLRSAVDGDDFVGAFRSEPVEGRIVVLDTEMYRSQMYDWLMAQGIENQDQIIMCALRGSSGSFRITDPEVREEWVSVLEDYEPDYLILDCFAPACAANGLDENSNTDIGSFLMAWDELLADADVPGSMIVHHMGNVAERGRGASRMRDWADSEIHLLIEHDGKEDTGGLRSDAARYIAAEGRDVAIPETQLKFNQNNRHLTVSGGSRSMESAISLETDVLAYIRDHPGCSRNSINTTLKRKPENIVKVVNEYVAQGAICRHGKGIKTGLFVRADCPEPDAH